VPNATIKICSIDGCGTGGQLRRGWCKKHYSRWRRHGDPLFTKYQELCTYEECSNAHYAKGYCTMHYQRWCRYGDASTLKAVSYETPEQAFLDRTEWQGDCLVWVGPRNPDGYGAIRINSENVGVHRYAWMKVNGPIPEGKVIDHKCLNRPCVNVEHLRLATFGQNCSNLSGANPSNKSTGVRNVSLKKGRFRVVVTKDRKQHYLGSYETLEEASEVAAKARAELFGEYAGLG